jgi:phosphohistidine phosphatase
MELILWRHADAEDANGKDDADRELTRKGRKQAERMADWLRPRLGDGWVIVVSPAKRALQTVKPLDLPFEVSEAVGTSAHARDVLRAAGWPRNEKNVVVVGHQPTLGEVASLLLTGEEGDTPVRKGAVWWFAGRDGGGKMNAILNAVLSPDLLDDPETR